MEKSTKYCITAVVVALIWFMAQPIGGNMSFDLSLKNVPYFNLTNSTVNGHAEISGYMPIGTIVPAFIAEALTSEQALFVYFTILSLGIAFCIYKILKGGN